MYGGIVGGGGEAALKDSQGMKECARKGGG